MGRQPVTPQAFLRDWRGDPRLCCNLVLDWARAQGRGDATPAGKLRRMAAGGQVLSGATHIAAALGLAATASPVAGDVAVFDQPGQGPALGLVMAPGFVGYVAGDGSRVVTPATILAAWSL